MKKFILILAAAICLCSCGQGNNPFKADESKRHRIVTVHVPSGYEVVTASRNDWGVSYLVKPMADDYIPTTKQLLQQNEVAEAWSTTVVFIESREDMTDDLDCWHDDEDYSSWGLEDDIDYD